MSCMERSTISRDTPAPEMVSPAAPLAAAVDGTANAGDDQHERDEISAHQPPDTALSAVVPDR